MNTILVVDNDSDCLKTYEKILENAHYRVLPASSVELARQILATGRAHLAILDIRMVDDGDEKDMSGLTLAKETEFRTIPKIMLTSHPTASVTREAFRPQADGRRPIVNFVAKNEGPSALIQAVQQAFAHDVHINWDLRLCWARGQPLSWPGLVGLLEPDLAPDALLDRMVELQSLFRKLFYRYEQITVSRLFWHKPARAALEVLAYAAGKEKPLLMTCVSVQPGQWPPVGSHSDEPSAGAEAGMESLHYMGTATTLSYADTREVQPFAAFFQEASYKQIHTGLDHLFRKTLAACYQSPIITEGQSLPQLCREHLGLTAETFTPAELEKRVHAIATEASNRGLAEKITYSSQLVEFLISPHLSLTGPDPAYFLFQDDAWPKLKIMNITLPGSLDIDTLLIDRTGQTWLLDSMGAGIAPIWLGFATLETGIRFRLTEPGSFDGLVTFEKHLLAARSLNGPWPKADVGPDYKKALHAIQALRHLASSLAEDAPESYFLALLFCTVEGLAAYDPATTPTTVELTKLSHRLLLASLLCAKLAEIKGQSQKQPLIKVRKTLRIDEHNRDIWVGERRLELTNTEVDLLVYLYLHAGKLCKRSDIGRGVFGLKGTDSEMENSLLNTNVDRLRQKVEDDPSSPQYIVTVRGQGYKLVVNPE